MAIPISSGRDHAASRSRPVAGRHSSASDAVRCARGKQGLRFAPTSSGATRPIAIASCSKSHSAEEGLHGIPNGTMPVPVPSGARLSYSLAGLFARRQECLRPRFA